MARFCTPVDLQEECTLWWNASRKFLSDWVRNNIRAGTNWKTVTQEAPKGEVETGKTLGAALSV